ncbi:MAG: PD40 domain-containing protein [Sandaracinaceae bacterium]|nr:PD40 domain-containing protein [Sandaracinaceae bacterium]
MLSSPPRALALTLALLGAGSHARADAGPVPSALLARRELTAGGYDHFQGQLTPDGSSVVFAGNADSTIEIFTQRIDRGLPRRLVDESADVHQPRVSPDGERVLYVSYREDAAGDACIVNRDGGGRRCVTGSDTATLHVFWFPDSRHVGVLTRRGIDGIHQLRRHRVDARGEGELLVERNMAAPAVSPDGRWLAYVPLEGAAAGARGALRRASRGLVLHPLDGGAPVAFEPNLPGTSALPAFGLDGAHLYFTQHLNDTNFDGALDGDDHGVLFRVPFATRDARPARPETYEQLTSGRTNCQYPAPARDRLVATCVRAGYLQIYAMPLTGLVPADWSDARLEAEIEASRDPWEQLFLLQRRVARARGGAQRAELYRRLVMGHLALREYDSAEAYLAPLARLAEAGSTLEGWVAVQREITDHRREEQRLRHGNLTEEFVDAQRARLGRLDALFSSEHGSVRRLARLAEAEIYLVLGDREAAHTMFDAIDVSEERDVSVLQAWAALAEGLLREENDRGGWGAVHRRLSLHPALSERDRLYHARAFVEALRAGRSAEQELPRLARARADAPDGSELALMLDLEVIFARVAAIGEDAALAELHRLRRAASSLPRHRAVAMAAIERAAHHDWGRVLDDIGRRWLEAVPSAHPERRYAEALFAEVMLERAYVELRRGGDARRHFLEITERTASLEAHVGYLEASLRAGVTRDALRAEYRQRFAEDDPVERFAEAYLTGRGLPEIDDADRHASEIERARALLRPVAEALPRSPEVHHLYAYLAHRHYHRTGDGEAARAAHHRYHLALDLAPYNPRQRANLLVELGLLQAALGNHRIALRHFTERDRLPFLEPASELSFRLARARSLFHVASYESARAEMARARVLVDEAPSLARYRPVVLDRAALYHHASGEHERAVELYRELIEATEGAALAVRMKARLGLGAAALGAGQLELAERTLVEVRAMLDADEPFRTEERERRAASHFDRDDYRPLVAGLLAETRRAAGDLAGRAEALTERRALYRERHRRFGRDAYLLEVARTSQQLAEVAYRRRAMADARRAIEEGLAAWDAWSASTGTPFEEVSLALIRAAAELHLYGGVPRRAFAFDLHARLQNAHLALAAAQPSERFAHERFLFGVYLTLMDLPAR